MTNKPSLSKKVTNNMDEETTDLLDEQTRQLLARIQALTPQQASAALAFLAGYTPEGMRAALNRGEGAPLRTIQARIAEHVRYCGSCDVASSDAYLQMVTDADTGVRSYFCADRDACGKRCAALHVAPPQADGQPANAGASDG